MKFTNEGIKKIIELLDLRIKINPEAIEINQANGRVYLDYKVSNTHGVSCGFISRPLTTDEYKELKAHRIKE